MDLKNGIVPGKMPSMNTTVTIDPAGRIVIPKAVRDALRLAPGDTLLLESDSESVTLRSLRPGSPLTKERGVWVFRGGGNLSTDDVNRALESVRTERDRRACGSSE